MSQRNDLAPMTHSRNWTDPYAGHCQEWKRGNKVALFVEGTRVTYTPSAASGHERVWVDFQEYPKGWSYEDGPVDQSVKRRCADRARAAARVVAHAKGGEAQDAAWADLIANR